MDVSKWKSQLRKGLLEYGLMHAIRRRRRLYGLEILAALEADGLPISEGTLYPLLSRLAKEGLLTSEWETESLSGHPRKYYLLSSQGQNTLAAMDTEWDSLMTTILAFKGDMK